MIGLVVVIAIVWVLLAVIVGLGVAQMIRRRDEQKPEPMWLEGRTPIDAEGEE